MSDKSELSKLVDAELAKFESKDAKSEEVKPETSVDEDTSELTSEASEHESDISKSETVEDPYLKEAIEMGFDPEYTGPNRKSPEQFVRDGSFFKKIDAQKKEIQELKVLMKQQLDHTRKVEKAATEKKLAEAQAEKLARVSEGDIDGYRTAELKEIAAKEALRQEELAQHQPAPTVTEDLKSFIDRNKSWCNFDTDENKNMAEDADLIISRAEKRNPGKPQKEILEMAEETIKKLYPHRFENPETKRPSLVSHSTTNKGTSAGSNSLSSKLSDRQKEFAKMARRVDPTFSIEQYAKELKLTGELRDE